MSVEFVFESKIYQLIGLDELLAFCTVKSDKEGTRYSYLKPIPTIRSLHSNADDRMSSHIRRLGAVPSPRGTWSTIPHIVYILIAAINPKNIEVVVEK
jgi:hypothetical protein